MPGIFKVGFNTIDSQCKIDKEGGKEVGKPTFHQWTAGPEKLRSQKFNPIVSGSADDDATVLADDAEDAIAKIRASKIGRSYDFEQDADCDDIKSGDWARSACIAIQIVRVEPVAFTTV
jgi:hypothetical protein